MIQCCCWPSCPPNICRRFLPNTAAIDLHLAHSLLQTHVQLASFRLPTCPRVYVLCVFPIAQLPTCAWMVVRCTTTRRGPGRRFPGSGHKLHLRVGRPIHYPVWPRVRRLRRSGPPESFCKRPQGPSHDNALHVPCCCGCCCDDYSTSAQQVARKAPSAQGRLFREGPM